MINTINVDTIPDELKAIHQWVVWMWAVRNDNRTKIPINPKTKRHAAVNDPETWGTFDEAHALATRWKYPGGIGFVFTADDPYCGIDLDKCRDVEKCEYTAEAICIINRIDTYTEVSPSGTGVKMICRASLVEGRNRTAGIEFYDRGRFFTVTGQHVPLTPLIVAERQEEVSALHADYFPDAGRDERQRPPSMASQPLDITDDELVRRIRRSKQGPKFDALYNGDTSAFESQSEADCALAAILAWWCRGNHEQILRLVQSSGLWRDKWERADYQRRTIDAGLVGITDFYGDRQNHDETPALERPTGPAATPEEIAKRQFLWMSELKGQAQGDKWIWEGYLSRKGITLMSALWKAGKTTLLAHLMKAFESDGDFCSLPLKSSKVLYVTEEDQSTWAERRDELGIGDHVGVVCRPFLGRPNAKQWDEFIAKIKADVIDYKFDLVVFDTLAKLWPVKDENAASQVDEALLPVWTLTDTDAAVLLVHHVRKGDGAEATGSRGSGALTAFVETIMELRRHTPTDKKCTRRTMTGYGRYRQTPDELVINLTPSGYVAEGDREECAKVDRMLTIWGILAGEPGMTADQILEEWTSQDKPSKPNKGGLLDLLNAGTDNKRWNRTGTGKRGNPYLFWKDAE